MNNLPSYVILDGSQAAVNLRAYLPTIGISSELYRHWVGNRIKELGLVEHQHYQLHKEGHVKKHVVTFPALIQLLSVGRFKALRQQQNVVQTFIDELIQEGLQIPDSLIGFNAILPSTTEENSVAVSLMLITPIAVPVLQIEGRAAVNAQDLFRVWNPDTDSRLAQWFSYRVTKLGFVLGKHYVEYNEPATVGHRRATTGYIVSIDAAIAIADAETKGKGRGVSQYLISYRKELAKQRLSTKGSLSDFIGLKPAVIPDSETGTSTGAQGRLFDDKLNTTGQQVPSAQRIDVDKTTEVSTQSGENPQEHSNEVFAQQDENSEMSTGQDLDAGSESTTTTGLENSTTPQPPTAATLLLQMAQLLLQQAHLLVDQEQKLNETKSTVGQIVAIGQQSALQTLGLSTGGEQPPQQTMRSRIRQIVNGRCRKTGEFQEQVYAFIYNRLYYIYGVSVASHHRQKDESYLELCERLGILEKVYSIVTGHEFTVAMNEAPVQPRSEAA